MADKSVRVILSATTAGFVAEVRKAEAAAKTLQGQLEKASTSAGWQKVGTDLGRVGLALTAVAGLAIKAWADFDQEMSAVAATGEDAKNSIDALRAAALQAGADTKYSATEAAAGVEALLKAGVSSADVLGGALSGALSLAASGNLGVADSAEVAATAMVQFGLSGAAVGHIADLLAAGAGKAQGEVSDMSAALKQSGLIAGQAGLSIEETTGTLAAFASAGLIGSEAGTSFRTMLMMLMNPTKEAASLMSEYGISVYDAAGHFTTMEGMAGQLKDKLGGLSAEQRNAALATIFGSYAIRGANVLYAQGAEGIAKWTAAVDDQGYASDVARTKMDNLKGDIEQLGGSLDTLAIQAGAASGGALRSLVQQLTELVNIAGRNPEAAQGILFMVASLGGLALVAAGVMKTVTAVSEFRIAALALTSAAPGAASAIGSIARGAGYAMVALAAASAAAQVLSNNAEMPGVSAGQVALVSLAASSDKMTASTLAASNAVSGSATSYGQATTSATRLASAADGASSSIDRMFQDRTGAGGSNDLVNGVNSLSTALDRLNNQGAADTASGIVRGLMGVKTEVQLVTDQFSQLDQAMSKVDPETARKSFSKIAEAADAQGMSVEKLIALFPEYKSRLESTAASLGVKTLSAQEYADWMGGKVPAAIEAASAKSKEGATASDGLKDALSNQALAAQKAADAQAELADQIKTAADAALAASGSEIAYQKSIDDAADAVAKNGKTFDETTGKFDTNTEAGRANKAAIDDVAATARKMAEANAANGASQAIVNANLADGRERFIAAAEAAGATEAAAKALADQYGLIPGAVVTSLSAPGAVQARDEAANLAAMLAGLPPDTQTYISTIARLDGVQAAQAAVDALHDKTITITTLNRTMQYVNGAYAATIQMAGGGPVYGPGTTTSDSILARLSNKEHVINAEAAEKYRPLLNAMNAGYQIPGFAGGGRVSTAPSYSMPAAATAALVPQISPADIRAALDGATLVLEGVDFLSDAVSARVVRKVKAGVS